MFAVLRHGIEKNGLMCDLWNICRGSLESYNTFKYIAGKGLIVFKIYSKQGLV